MATKIKTLKNRQGDIVIPRTLSSAITMEDGTSLEYAVKNSSTDSVKITQEVADIIGTVAGIDLSTFLVNYTTNTSNTLAVAEIVE